MAKPATAAVQGVPLAKEHLDRILGCIYGTATGDALGTTLEFAKRDSEPRVTEMVGQGPFDLQKGQWTDDTSQTLCLAQSLIYNNGKLDAKDLESRLQRWMRQGHLSSNGCAFDIGNTTMDALTDKKEYHKSQSNGSLMRVAPIALLFRNSPELALQMAAEQSRVTHPHVVCQDACRYMTALILGALQGVSKEALLAPLFCPVPPIVVTDDAEPETYDFLLDSSVPGGYDTKKTTTYWDRYPLHPEILAIAQGSFAKKSRDQIESSPLASPTLEAALWAFAKTSTFEAGCIEAVNLGNDADTVGAVYGMLAGAFYGAQKIPERWRVILSLRPVLETTALQLYHAPAAPANSKPHLFQLVQTALNTWEQLFNLLILPPLDPKTKHPFRSIAEFDQAVQVLWTSYDAIVEPLSRFATIKGELLMLASLRAEFARRVQSDRDELVRKLLP